MQTTNSYEIDMLESRSSLQLARNIKPNPFDSIINDLLADDMQRFMVTLEKALLPQQKYLTDTEYMIYRRGKKLRPIMLILSARLIMGNGYLPDKIIQAAVSLEMLHVATLIHDDIIDEALLRRGLKSVNATRGVNAAILVGDMQFVQAIRCFIDAIETDKEMGLAKLVLDTAFKICCGELDEIEANPMQEIEKLKEHYFEVIERKTAIMFGLACETGAALANGHTSDARRIGFYGRRVGRAFQIMDDLFDFLQEDKEAGKIKGTDLTQKRLSLPIIYAMEELGADHLVSRIIKGHNPTTIEFEKALESIKDTSGFMKTYADARFQAIDALEYLKPFKQNVYWDALKEIALYTVDRSF